MDTEEQPSRVSEAAHAYRVSTVVTASPTYIRPRNDVVDAFELIPPEYRGNLSEYFATVEGQRALPIFLNKRSAWWSGGQRRIQPDVTQAIGLLEGDPILDQLTESIQKKRRR